MPDRDVQVLIHPQTSNPKSAELAPCVQHSDRRRRGHEPQRRSSVDSAVTEVSGLAQVSRSKSSNWSVAFVYAVLLGGGKFVQFLLLHLSYRHVFDFLFLFNIAVPMLVIYAEETGEMPENV